MMDFCNVLYNVVPRQEGRKAHARCIGFARMSESSEARARARGQRQAAQAGRRSRGGGQEMAIRVIRTIIQLLIFILWTQSHV
jgi:hypothetical protein